jgi:hypothetical protein
MLSAYLNIARLMILCLWASKMISDDSIVLIYIRLPFHVISLIDNPPKESVYPLRRVVYIFQHLS